MQSLASCRNRRFVISTKFLNTVLRYGTRKYTVFNLRSTNVFLNSKPNKLPIPTYKEIRKELSVLHSLFVKNGFIKTNGSSRILGTRYYSTSSSNRNDSSDRDGSKEPKKPENELMVLYKFTAISFLLFYILLFLKANNNAKEEILVSWHEFEHQMLAKGEVKEIWIDPNIEAVIIILHKDAIINGSRSPFTTFILDISSLEAFEEKLRKAEQRLGIKMGDGVPIIYKRRTELIGATVAVLLTVGVISLLYTYYKKNPFKMDITSRFTRANYTLVKPFSGKGVRFDDVAGLKEAKTEVMEFVDYLKNPERYKTLGAKVPKGALLLGPPGCGKTLLAKAVATEANVYFFSMNGSEFIEMLGGLGAARVRSLFQEAKKKAPSIIYIDEIDAIGKKRSEHDTENSNSESDRTLNQLLAEMDGVTTHENVILLASTNRANVLDKALLRPGRFDRHIVIDLPTSEERKQIFETYLKSLSLDGPPSKYSGFLAYLTPGFSGADIANLCNEAALHAVRNQKKVVSGDDLLYAIDRMIGGSKKKTNPLTPAVKKVVAYHEAGHIIVGWLLEHTDALLKVAIVPRTNLRLGFSQHIESDVKLHSKEQLFQRMCMMLGGRVAEYLIFNEISTNAEDDLKKVTKLAYHQVQQYGMSSTVGLISFDEESTTTKTKKVYSKKLASIMDAEVRRIIGEAYKTAEDLLRKNNDKLVKVAQALFEKETLTYEDIEKLIGPPPYGKKRLVQQTEYEKGFNQTESKTPEPSPA